MKVHQDLKIVLRDQQAQVLRALAQLLLTLVPAEAVMEVYQVLKKDGVYKIEIIFLL